MQLIKGSLWGAAGAALAYLFDPVSGKSRRVKLKDQAYAKLRDSGGLVKRKARYEAGRVKGLLYGQLGSDDPTDDTELLQKVRSEAVGMVPGPLDYLEVRVEDGVVLLLGESRDRAREHDLIERIEEVAGVRDIRNELVRAPE